MIRWRGIHKLNEEIGEVLRITGKLGAFPISGTSPIHQLGTQRD